MASKTEPFFERDLFPFIATSDDSASCPYWVAFISIFGAICWDIIYNESCNFFGKKDKKTAGRLAARIVCK